MRIRECEKATSLHDVKRRDFVNMPLLFSPRTTSAFSRLTASCFGVYVVVHITKYTSIDIRNTKRLHNQGNRIQDCVRVYSSKCTSVIFIKVITF